jgi:hypothetical protein
VIGAVTVVVVGVAISAIGNARQPSSLPSS